MKALLATVWGLGFAINPTQAEAYSVECHVNADGTYLVADKVHISIAEKKDCEFDVALARNIDGRGSIGVIVGPPADGLGINSQKSIYVKVKRGVEFDFAGNLPAGAEWLGQGRFRYLSQEGGARYLSHYFFKDRKIVPDKNASALLLDGDYCIDRGTLANVNDMPEGQSCKIKIRATFKTPICIQMKNEISKIVQLDRCGQLRK